MRRAGWHLGGRKGTRSFACRQGHSTQGEIVATTKAAEVYDKVEALVASGTPKAEAFKQLAREYGQPVDSMRGAYYGEKRKREGGGKSSRTRRRETTPEDALADARASLERSIEAIDR